MEGRLVLANVRYRFSEERLKDAPDRAWNGLRYGLLRGSSSYWELNPMCRRMETFVKAGPPTKPLCSSVPIPSICLANDAGMAAGRV